MLITICLLSWPVHVYNNRMGYQSTPTHPIPGPILTWPDNMSTSWLFYYTTFDCLPMAICCGLALSSTVRLYWYWTGTLCSFNSSQPSQWCVCRKDKPCPLQILGLSARCVYYCPFPGSFPYPLPAFPILLQEGGCHGTKPHKIQLRGCSCKVCS